MQGRCNVPPNLGIGEGGEEEDGGEQHEARGAHDGSPLPSSLMVTKRPVHGHAHSGRTHERLDVGTCAPFHPTPHHDLTAEAQTRLPGSPMQSTTRWCPLRSLITDRYDIEGYWMTRYNGRRGIRLLHHPMTARWVRGGEAHGIGVHSSGECGHRRTIQQSLAINFIRFPPSHPRGLHLPHDASAKVFVPTGSTITP